MFHLLETKKQTKSFLIAQLDLDELVPNQGTAKSIEQKEKKIARNIVGILPPTSFGGGP